DPTLKINEVFPDDQGKTEEGPLLVNTIYSTPSKADDESLLDHNTLLVSFHQQDADNHNPLLDELLNHHNHNDHYKEKMIPCSDLDAAILSLLEDEYSLGEEVPVEVVGPRVAQANSFDPRPDCNYNGASTSRKRPCVNHLLNLDFGEKDEQLGGEEENMGPQFLYEADASLGLMLRLTGGAGWGTDVWAEDICCIVACVDWEEASGALSSYSLLHLAQRCSWAEKIDTETTFIRIMYELFLVAKVNSILHENSKDGAPLSSAYPAITSIVREGITHNNMHNWLNAGSHWGGLASAAGQPGLASKLRSKAVSSTILFALCNDLHWPDNAWNSEEGTILQLKSWFREDSIPKSNPFPAKISSCKTWTEEKHAAASKAISSGNIEELAEKLMDQYDKVSEKIRKNQKWLKVPQHLIARREINLRDQDNKLIFHADGTLSAEVRTNLFNSLWAWCQTVNLSMSGANLKTMDSSSNTAFTALHFSYHAKYGVSINLESCTDEEGLSLDWIKGVSQQFGELLRQLAEAEEAAFGREKTGVSHTEPVFLAKTEKQGRPRKLITPRLLQEATNSAKKTDTLHSSEGEQH
ncbi:hypothetical protein F5876DRAFT_70432, partial [Lentinula aff. lateritia]